MKHRHIRLRLQGRKSLGGFTLIEMIVVIAIIGLMVALAIPGLMGTIKSSRLTSAGQNLLGRLAQAQQAAASMNRPVELRFYKYIEPDDVEYGEQFGAYQFFSVDVASDASGVSTESVKAMGAPFILESGVIISSSNIASYPASPLLANDKLQPDGSGLPGSPRFERAAAQYVALRFYPDGIVKRVASGSAGGSGTAGIKVAESLFLPSAYLTIVANSDAAGGASVANYYAIQIDPYTGHSRTYQPEL